jgi:hypothetical protein
LESLGFRSPVSQVPRTQYIVTIFERLGTDGKDHIGGGVYMNGVKWKSWVYDQRPDRYQINSTFDSIMVINTAYLRAQGVSARTTSELSSVVNASYPIDLQVLQDKNSVITGVLDDYWPLVVESNHYSPQAGMGGCP